MFILNGNGQGNDMVGDSQFVNFFNQVFHNWGDVEFFNWKYTKNPFGQNITKYSIEDNQLVATRFFMRWTMHSSTQTFRCYQATDSATLASHRGRGLFQRLTFDCLNQLEQDDFVFNFPNQNSHSVYIKMGWKHVEKIRPLIVPVINHFTNKSVETDASVPLIGTQWNDELLEWRLSNGRTYHVLNLNEKRCITYRLVRIKGLKIADIIQSHPNLTLLELKQIFLILLRRGIFVIRYIGLNTSMRALIEKNALIKFHYGSGVNFVTKFAPEPAQFRVEMIDADYI